MSIANELEQWLATRSKPKAIICDIDETLCTHFDLPIQAAIEILRRLSREVEVYYVTARPPQTRAATVAFLEEHRLPFAYQLYLCEPWQTTLRHKTTRMTAIASENDVILSIGDTAEDGVASHRAGVPFVRVDLMDPAQSWRQAEALLQPWLQPKEEETL